MRRCLIATAAALLCATAPLIGQAAPPPTGVMQLPGDAPQAWFVELVSPPAADGTALAQLDAEAQRFHLSAARAGITYRESRHFRDLWNGLAVETDADGADALRAVPGVRAVYPVVAAGRAQADAGGQPEGTLATARTTTGVERLQQGWGFTGRGVRVAVVDSGLDYDHPDFGGCFGIDCRVSKGWDFVGDAFNPDRNSPGYSPIPVPDPLPDDCDGHGTHVAGIIGANGVITGVAPKVDLFAYRVFGCAGPTTTEVMLAAMERAYQDGADILNISIGTPYQWPDYPTAQAADRLAQRGMIVVSSAGNEGSNGLYAAAAPGIGRDTIGVASFDNAFASVAAFSVTPDDRRIGYTAATGSAIVPTSGGGPLARTGSAAATADACGPLPADSLAGRIALIRRGTCGFAVKAGHAQAAGAVAAVVYNNAPGRIPIELTGTGLPTIPVVSISGEDGTLLSHRLAGSAVTLTWTTDAVQEPLPTANRISAFSSYGPTADLALKPDLGAPGGAVRSTLPLERGGYGTISGTSMSAPYVAGAMALLLEARPGLSPADALTRVQNTAVPHALSSAPDSGLLDVVHRQGAGMIAVDQAVLTAATVTPARLALGDFDTGMPIVARLTVHGAAIPPAKHGVTYTLGHQPAPATGASTFSPAIVASFATVEFSVSGLAGGGDVFVRITPPAAPAARLFGGYITFTPDDGGPVLRVPYLGYNGNYQAITALTPTAADFPWLAKASGASVSRQRDGATYTLAGGDVPILLFHLEHQVRALDVEIIDAASGASFGPATAQEYVGRNGTATAFFSFAWNGTYAPTPGSAPVPVPNGAYRLELRALKAGGHPASSADVERWTSPPIVITRPATTP